MSSRRLDCERIAHEAAALLRSRFGDPGEVRDKGDSRLAYDVVTEVDVLCEQLVLRRIEDLSPGAFVLAEESGLTTAAGTPARVDPHDADEVWIVDPLDGTINFAHGIPHFAVSVACWQRGEPVAGAIVDPMVGETFSFERHGTDAAAFHEGRRIELVDAPAGDSIVYIGSSVRWLPEVLACFRGCRQLASACLALAWTGVGRTGAYVQPGELNAWDWAVGAPFVQAAGGIVTDEHGRDWPASLLGTTGILAAAPSIHADVLAVLAEA